MHASCRDFHKVLYAIFRLRLFLVLHIQITVSGWHANVEKSKRKKIQPKIEQASNQRKIKEKSKKQQKQQAKYATMSIKRNGKYRAQDKSAMIFIFEYSYLESILLSSTLSFCVLHWNVTEHCSLFLFLLLLLMMSKTLEKDSYRLIPFDMFLFRCLYLCIILSDIFRFIATMSIINAFANVEYFRLLPSAT